MGMRREEREETRWEPQAGVAAGVTEGLTVLDGLRTSLSVSWRITGGL